MHTNSLPVSDLQGHNDRKFQHIAGTSYRHNAIAGIGVLNPLGAKERRVLSRLNFACRSGIIYDGLSEAPEMEAGSKWPVRQPRSVRPHVIGVARGRVTNLHLESIMSTSIKGTLPEIRFISRATIEKRIRRELAKSGRKLLKSRPGTAAHREYGQYAIENGLRRVVAINHDLLLLAHELGVLKPWERLKPKYDRISVMSYRDDEGDTDRIKHYVVGKPGTGKLLFDLLEGPFEELADAEEARDLMGGRGHD